MPGISVKALRARFAYDPATGFVTYAVGRGNCVKGDRAGSLKRKSGYRMIRIGNKEMREHRVIFALVEGRWPSDCLDHVNGDRSDNRWENLREATQAQNKWNGRGSLKRKASAKGVCFHRAAQKWRAKIGHGGVMYELGLFDTYDAAVMARKAAASDLYGDFAYERRSAKGPDFANDTHTV